MLLSELFSIENFLLKSNMLIGYRGMFLVISLLSATHVSVHVCTGERNILP